MMEYRDIPWSPPPPRVPYEPPHQQVPKKPRYTGWMWYLVGLVCLTEAIFHFVTPMSVLNNIFLLLIGIFGITISTFVMTLCSIVRKAIDNRS